MVDAFLKLLNELLFERELAGGELTQEQESEYAGRLTDIWNQLTEEQQDEVEALHQRVPGAPVSLHLEDVDVQEGTTVLPRRTTCASCP